MAFGKRRTKLQGWMMRRAHKHLGTYKRVLLEKAQGIVLEIGAGTGSDLVFFPKGIQYIPLEPNVHALPELETEIAVLGIEVVQKLVGNDVSAEAIPLPDASVDVVVGMFVLCSVSQPAQAVKEILRVLKPGGQYLYMEHVAAERGSVRRFFQNIAQPVWGWWADGCDCARETEKYIGAATFATVSTQRMQNPAGWQLCTPLISGIAQK